MIKVKIRRWRNAVLMQILEQINIKRGCGLVFENRDAIMYSASTLACLAGIYLSDYPTLQKKSEKKEIVWIQGECLSMDLSPAVRVLEDKKKAKIYQRMLKKLFKEYNNSKVRKKCRFDINGSCCAYFCCFNGKCKMKKKKRGWQLNTYEGISIKDNLSKKGYNPEPKDVDERRVRLKPTPPPPRKRSKKE